MPAPFGPFSFPCRIVRPEIVTVVRAATSIARSIWPASRIVRDAPAPWIVMSAVMFRSPVASPSPPVGEIVRR
jgi:hypothetical protein